MQPPPPPQPKNKIKLYNTRFLEFDKLMCRANILKFCSHDSQISQVKKLAWTKHNNTHKQTE